MLRSTRWPLPSIVVPVALSTLLALMLTGLSPAAAHPFGPPLTARLSADDDQVSVQWNAAEDDWVILGEHVDAFAEQGGNQQSMTGAERLRQSPKLRDYLLGHIGVTQAGTACPGTIEIADDVLDDGARLTFSCPRPVNDVEITMTPLTDINENYRTAALSETASEPEQTMFTATDPVQAWHFNPASGSTSASPWLVGGAIALVLGLGLATAFAIIRRLSTRPGSTAGRRQRRPA